jgi:hypothetical protein
MISLDQDWDLQRKRARQETADQSLGRKRVGHSTDLYGSRERNADAAYSAFIPSLVVFRDEPTTPTPAAYVRV